MSPAQTLTPPLPDSHDICPLLQVLEKANLLDQDLEVEGDPDGPAPGGIWGSWAPSTFPTPAELEWDPAGDVGGLGPSGQKITRMPGAPCELCGYRGPQSSGQGLKVRSAPPQRPPAWLGTTWCLSAPSNMVFPFQRGLGSASPSKLLSFV